MARKTYKVKKRPQSKKYKKNKRTTRKKNMKGGGMFNVLVSNYLMNEGQTIHHRNEKNETIEYKYENNKILKLLYYDLHQKNYNISGEICIQNIDRDEIFGNLKKNYQERIYCIEDNPFIKYHIKTNYNIGSANITLIYQTVDDKQIAKVIKAQAFILIEDITNFKNNEVRAYIHENIGPQFSIPDIKSSNYSNITRLSNTNNNHILFIYEWNVTDKIKVIYNDILANLIPSKHPSDIAIDHEFSEYITNLYKKFEENPYGNCTKKNELPEIYGPQNPTFEDFGSSFYEEEDTPEVLEAARKRKEAAEAARIEEEEKKKAARKDDAKERAQQIIDAEREKDERIKAEEAARKAEEEAENAFEGFGNITSKGGKRRHKRKTYKGSKHKRKKKYNKHSKKYKYKR